jgi:Na+/H+ antiporter NhaD/arsenite permease-like protein
VWDKVSIGLISLTCIGVIVVIMVWVGPAMQRMNDETVTNAHQVRFNSHAGIAVGINGIVGGDSQTPPLEASTGSNAVTRIIETSDDNVIFDIRLVAGVSSNEPVISHGRRHRRILQTNNPQTLTAQITYTSDVSSTPANCLANPPLLVTYDDQETELLATVGASAIRDGGLCPSLSTASSGSVFEWSLTSTSATPIGVVFQVLTLPPWAAYRVLLAGLLLIAVFVFIAIDIIHRTLVAMVGSLVALTLLGATGEFKTLQQVVVFIDEEALALLFGMMVMVFLLSTTGVFEWLAVRVLIKSKGSVKKLFVLLALTTGSLSFFLDNTSVMLLTAPVTIELCKVLEVNPVPFLIGEVVFSNIGGTATMIGDPPNIILGSLLSEYVTFVDFIVSQMPPILLMSPIVMLFLVHFFRETVCVPHRELGDISVLKRQYPITQPLMLVKNGTIMITVLILFFLSAVHRIATAWIAILGAIMMMIVASPRDLHSVFEHVEWDALLFFAALFVMIEAMAELGLISWIGDVLSDIIGAAPAESQLVVAIVVIIWISAIVSGFLDNIPYTTTMVPVILQLSSNLQLPIRPLIWSLSFGACLGGNLTLVGASANLITAGAAEHCGHKIGFVEFMKVGFFVVVISTSIACVYAVLLYGVAGWQSEPIAGGNYVA